MKRNLQWLTTYIRPNKWLLVLATILMIAESYSNLLIIGLQQRLIDDVLIANNYDQLYFVLLYMILAFILYSLLFTFGPHTIHITKATITEHIVQDFMRHMYKIPALSLQKQRTGSYVHYIVSDIDRVGAMIADDIPRGLQQLAAALVLFCIVGFSSPTILFVSLLCCIVYVWLGRYFSVRLKNQAKQVQKTRSDLIVHIEEGISSTREVIAYHRIEWETNIYNRFFKKYFETVMKEGRLVNLQLISSEPIRWGITVFILGYGGYLVLQGQMSIGIFVILYQFSNQLVTTFQNLFNMTMDFSSKMASFERVRGVMDGPTWENGSMKIDEKIETLQLNHICFKYDKETDDILQRLSMDIPIGKKVAIVGTSGSGKSTIAQLLIRFFDPLTGAINVNGHTLCDIDRSDWARRVAIVFQEPYLYPDTIHNNILMGLDNFSKDELVHVCQIAAIHDYILSLPDGYDTVIGERGITLSGGQRQRIAIARALIRKPEILILDESTSALDLITEREIQDNIDQFRKGQTTIIIAHRLSTIKNADCIFVLNQGLVVEKGKHDELMQKEEFYYKLINSEEDISVKVSS
ncbi:ABC transporter ATP-binding protein [Lederbergia lenta]|uniref:ABC transporter ATP-binding protein/permease n=1 Tax=Lederbergia lenta TaxID=1467 RepID=A0A2X4Z6C6_LEDLE|nr:ABC transporter ATP-binding protein [Lederbergia lenta]MCM3109798.1 ABC transporter ATP-binding protein/permease [Lederbergia lenta]MEC2324452.1 ABC transporter ATP-binding protein [Lederbergia lenta]SQI59825.1 ABC transporter ATP-binding protein/permease [Lederbergia lenta]